MEHSHTSGDKLDRTFDKVFLVLAVLATIIGLIIFLATR